MQKDKQIALYQKIHEHPLFKGTSQEVFQQLLTTCKLNEYQKGDKIIYFEDSDEGLFLVLDGRAEVFIESEQGLSVLLEILLEGQIIGLSHIAQYLKKLAYPMHKQHVELEFVERTYSLQIPAAVVKARLEEVHVNQYLLRKTALRLGNVYSALGDQVKLGEDWGKSEPFVQRAQDLMSTPAITIRKTATAKEIAHVMIEQKISSVMVIDKDDQLTGIITEKDLVQRVLAQTGDALTTAENIMTQSPFTVSPHHHYYEVLSTFYQNGVKHLPVVEQNQVVGMITFQNLISKRDRGAIGILKTIENASYDRLPIVKKAVYDVLTNLIADEISTIHTLEIITKLYDRLARHCVALAVDTLDKQGHGAPPVPFSWYQMGSGARGEQFMLTDQDHFLVYADSADAQVEQYFALLGDEIVRHLEQAGYKRCDGKMMASETIWRGSLSDWQTRFQEWFIQTTDEQILLGFNFLSFRFIYGDRTIDRTFTTLVQQKFKNAQTFLYYMTQQEQYNPIPQFTPSRFKLFKTKEKNEMIDIKLNALFPMHHCLQILGVLKGLMNRTPLELLEGLVEVGELSDGFALDIRHAYEVALKARIQLSWTKHLRGEQSTTVIQFNAIRRWERDELKTMLTTVHALQQHLLAKL